jgi:hypothetical protein
MKLASLAIFAVLIVGCGSDPIATTDGGGGGNDGPAVVADLSGSGSVDQAPGGPPDLTTYVPPTDGGKFTCGTESCNPATQVCCVKLPNDAGVGGGGSCVATGQCSSGLPVQCGGPEFCGGKPCCLTLANKMPKDITCSAAQTDCAPNIDLSGSGKTRLCHVDTDCTAGAANTAYPNCCKGTQGGVEQHFCFSKAFAMIAGFDCGP